MATLAGILKAEGAAKIVAEPSEKLETSVNHGRIRRAYDEYTIPAADELGTSAIVHFSKLPKGARIVDARWIGPNITAGAANIGWAANGVDSAEAAGLFAAAATAMSAAKDLKLSAVAVGYNKKFGAETQLQAAISTLTDGGGGEKIALEVFYVVD
jgi:hypothetical protein